MNAARVFILPCALIVTRTFILSELGGVMLRTGEERSL